MNVIEEKRVTELRDKIACIHRQFLEDETTECQYLDDYIAEKLYEAGYCKASDVARKIFAEIEKIDSDTASCREFYYRIMNFKDEYESEDEE